MSEQRKWYNTPLFRQFFLSICISMSFFNIGLIRGFSSTGFPKMFVDRPDLLPDKVIWSWAGSVAPLGGFFGTIVAFPMLHLAGRKNSVLISSPLGAIAWSTIALAPSWPYLIAGRFMCGLCSGLCLPAAQIYVTESTDAKTRGVIGSLPSLAMSLGVLVSYVIGTFVQWNTLAWMGSITSISLSFIILFLPESPTWLESKQKHEKAEKSKKWLKLELQTKPSNKLMAYDSEKKTCYHSSNNLVFEPNHHDQAHSWQVLLSRPILKPLGIGLTLLLIQEFSGIDSVVFFTVDIFRSSGSSIDGHLATIMVGILQLVSNILSLFVIDRAGRKPLLIGSAFVMSVSMASMGVAFYLTSLGYSKYGLLPIVSLFTFMLGFSFGFGSIPFLLMGEIFPAAQRSLLSSIAGCFNVSAMFFVIKTYHPLEALITTAGTFWMYSALCAVGMVFVIVCVPETKGRNIEEIAKLFHKEHKYSPASNDEQKHIVAVKQ